VARGPDLREAWADLLRRRPAFAEVLAVYQPVLEAWAVTDVTVATLGWSADDCRARWNRGVPLIAEAAPPLDRAALEEALGPAMDHVAAVRDDVRQGLQAFAAAWDRGAITPGALLPARGRVAVADGVVALDADVLAFLATAALRPALEQYFAPCRPHLDGGPWRLGICPFCGGPPGFSDVGEDGRRWLACHLCGGAWTFARLACPFCGNEESSALGRVQVEGAEEGYVVSTCRACGAYVKELDRRVRWDGGPAVVEDWGSPHLDLVAQHRGYWRPAAPLVIGGRRPMI
jgi:FdhE protein